MVLIHALVAVIHACLKALAAVALAMTSLALGGAVLIIGFFAALGFLGVTGAGGFGLARRRKKRRQGEL